MIPFAMISLAPAAAAGMAMLGLKSLFGRKEKKFQCPMCKADIEATAKSCPKCKAIFEEGGFQCPHCKAPVTEWDKECTNCGEKFDLVENYACPECGRAVKGNAKRCPECGAKFWSPIKPSVDGDRPKQREKHEIS